LSGGKLIRDHKPLKWYTFIVSFTTDEPGVAIFALEAALTTRF